MSAHPTHCLLRALDDEFVLDDYKSAVQPRWCSGCGDNSILAAVQRLCRDDQLPPERTVFVSGIGCSSRFPHYMNTYGFHGLHGRALAIAEGVKMRRRDLSVFVVTGDGDCCSIGTAHWIHALRYNMDMTVLLHDNQVYGLTKMQASPTSPHGMKSRTSPHGTWLQPLNPLTVTLGVTNASFVAQAVDWIPELLFQIVAAAHRHKGLGFVRILQRCPEFMPHRFDAWLQDPDSMLLLDHPDGITIGDDLSRVYRQREAHDPADIHRAREIASMTDRIPVGILYRDETVPCYEDLRRPAELPTAELVESVLESEFDKVTIRPD